ncbi:DUF6602 domain-containing protein [Parvimonas micra]|uniref:DUF6602 domain-containing protein n=1 Tax=Parvimonas micra TaxID=33033 RepID=UPI0028DC2522|nr:DUF6602 domain-containing protein [Parvimonas micra]
MKKVDFIKDIKENYLKMEKELVTQLNYNVTNHDLTAGTYREEIWADFFRRIVPKKFNIARSVFIIDSNENISKEVDIAIYDEQYTPYIFNYGLIKFIPIEAVAAVVQCKSTSLKKNILLNWTKSINKLNTSTDSVVRLATNIHIGNNINEINPLIQIATTPIKILCYISEIKKINRKNEGKDSFDIIIEAYQNKKDTNKSEKNKNNNKSDNSVYLGNLNILIKNNPNLYDILCQYNRNNLEYNNDRIKKDLTSRKITDYDIFNGKDKYTLLSFIFQFNQMLMMINNPMFFPHKAYVDMFNKNTKKGE